MTDHRDVVVVGGGITGLAAARDLAVGGAAVTVVDPGPLGGKLQSAPFDGGHLDTAADAFLARVPEGLELCRELGIDGDLVSPASRRAYVWSYGALRALPDAHVLGVPTDLDELAATGILSGAGIAAAERDHSTPLVAPDHDPTIGAVVRERLGDEVAERLVDPLVGGINAGNTDHLSLVATTPQLDAALRSGAPGLVAACAAQRAAADPSTPVFFAPAGGMGSLATALAADVHARAVDVVAERAIGLDAEGSGWRVALDGGRALPCDAVVLAVPAPAASGFLADHAPRAAALLRAIPYASVAIVAIAVERSAVDHPLDGSGYLVPRVEGRLVTACSWATSKWPHLADADTVWLRASVGRDGDDRFLELGDDALVAQVLGDLRDTMALGGDPRVVRVTRWPASFPQYRPGHLEAVATVEADLDALPRPVRAVGAALRGLGVPACIRQGRAAARWLSGK